MTKQEAEACRRLFASRWPGMVHATIHELADSCAVSVRVVRENRIVRIGNAQHIPGGLDAVAALLETPGLASGEPHPSEYEQKPGRPRKSAVSHA